MLQVAERHEGVERFKRAPGSLATYIELAEMHAEYEPHDPSHKNKADRLRVLMAGVHLAMYAVIEGSCVAAEIEAALEGQVLLDVAWRQRFCTDKTHDALCDMMNRPDLKSEHHAEWLHNWHENREPLKGPDWLPSRKSAEYKAAQIARDTEMRAARPSQRMAGRVGSGGRVSGMSPAWTEESGLALSHVIEDVVQAR